MLVAWYVDGLICWLLDMLTAWYLDCLICWLLDMLIVWYVDGLICWWLVMLIAWYLDCLICWLHDIFDGLICWLLDMSTAPNNFSTHMNHIQSPWIQRPYVSFKCWNEILQAGMEKNIDLHLNKISVESRTQIMFNFLTFLKLIWWQCESLRLLRL